MNAYPCVITNNSGQTIWVKLIGYHWEMFSMPKWPGPGNDGLLYTSGPQQNYSANLLEGDRVVNVFANTGSFMAATKITISAPTTVTIGTGGIATAAYHAGGAVAGGE